MCVSSDRWKCKIVSLHATSAISSTSSLTFLCPLHLARLLIEELLFNRCQFASLQRSSRDLLKIQGIDIDFIFFPCLFRDCAWDAQLVWDWKEPNRSSHLNCSGWDLASSTWLFFFLFRNAPRITITYEVFHDQNRAIVFNLDAFRSFLSYFLMAF